MKNFHDDNNYLVIDVINREQNQNNPLNDFDRLRQLASDGSSENFFELLRSGHFNIDKDYGIPIGLNNETPVHLVCAEGRVDILSKIFNHHEQRIIDYTNALRMYEEKMGFTPILTVTTTGHEECFKILLDKLVQYFENNSFNADDILSFFTNEKKNIDNSSNNSKSNDKATNLLHIIAQQDDVKILKYLSTMAEDHEQLRYVIKRMLKVLDANGSTPLHFAARSGYLDMVKLLLEIADLCENPSNTEIIRDKNNLNENKEEDNSNETHDINTFQTNRQQVASTDNISEYRNRALSFGSKVVATHTGIRLFSKNVSANTSGTLILKENLAGCAPIHDAAERGHKEIVVHFINVAFAHRQHMFTIQNKKGQTPLHLAAMKGHANVIEVIFKYIHQNHIIIKDASGSTLFHYAAQLTKNMRGKSVDILCKFKEAQEKWIKPDRHLLEDFVKPLTECNNDGYNCLEVAIMKDNHPFVEHIFKLEKSQWECLMKNAQITKNRTRVDTPMRKLIKYMPDIACIVFHECITNKEPDENSLKNDNKKTIEYDFQFLEDHCHVQEWDYTRKNKSEQTNVKNRSKSYENNQSCCNRLLKKFTSISFYSTDRKQKFVPFNNNPYILIKNQALSIITNQTTLSNLRNVKNVKLQTRLFEHPLCQQLSLLKWRQFGYFVFLPTFICYTLFLGLFTWTTLRNIEPTRFYDAVNVSYGDIYSIKNIENCRLAFDKLNARNDEQIQQLDHRKDTTDYVLKYSLYIILCLHIVKGALCILGVYQFRIRGLFYAEVVALILCFAYLYDDPDWQKDTRLRCIGQWQIGSFGLFLAWATLLGYMRFSPYFGIYVVMLEVIIIKFLWFAPILIILICSFAFSFYMLLQSELPFSNIGFAWLRSAFMITDLGYEDRLFGSDGLKVIVPYPVLFPLFILYGVTIMILVTNLLIGLAVGEIPTLSQLSHLYSSIMHNELLNSCEIFRLRYLFCPSIVYLNEEIKSQHPGFFRRRLHWFRKYFLFRPIFRVDDGNDYVD